MTKIRKVTRDTNRPILIDFQNGKFESEEFGLESSIFYQKNGNQKVVGVSADDMLYGGLTNNENNDYNTFMAIQTENDKIELIQIDTCMVAPLFENKKATTTPVKGASLADLRKQFGSKKAKRYTEQQERLIMNIENVKEHLETTVKDIMVKDLPAVNQDDNESLYKPKINRSAENKEDVYKLEDLISTEVLDSLQEPVCELLEADDLTSYSLIPTVEKLILSLRSSSYPKQTILDKCKIVLFANYLIKFILTPLKSMTKRYCSCDCSMEVDKYLKQHFTVNGTRPITMKDKSICFTIVLLMLANNYELDLEMISKDMKIGLKKNQEFARNLGFSQSSKNKNIFILKVPVPGPILPNLKRKRK